MAGCLRCWSELAASESRNSKHCKHGQPSLSPLTRLRGDTLTCRVHGVTHTAYSPLCHRVSRQCHAAKFGHGDARVRSCAPSAHLSRRKAPRSVQPATMTLSFGACPCSLAEMRAKPFPHGLLPRGKGARGRSGAARL
eukprot:5012913-Prymnesium_polylepis.1